MLLLLGEKENYHKCEPGIGQEAIAVGATYALNKGDYIFPMHRNLGVFTTRELDLEKLFSQLMGKQGGYTRGRDRTFHFCDKDKILFIDISSCRYASCCKWSSIIFKVK